ncbi:MAG: hypothetical protein ACT4OK_10425 [Gemmobacter sp.]
MPVKMREGTLGLISTKPLRAFPMLPRATAQPYALTASYDALPTIPAGLYPVAEHHRAAALKADAFYTVRYHKHSITHGAFFADVYLFGDANRILATICSAATIIKDRDNPRWIDAANEIAGPALRAGKWEGHSTEYDCAPPRSPYYITDDYYAPNMYVITDEHGHAFVKFADWDCQAHDDLARFFMCAPVVVKRIVASSIFSNSTDEPTF